MNACRTRGARARLLQLPCWLLLWCLFVGSAAAMPETAGAGQSAAPAEGAESTTPAALPEGVERVTSVEGITEYRLANGLTVLLFPDQTKQTITVNITYLVGSRHENYGETGMAHLLEHLLFKGTPRHPNIPQELTERGARPNGTTWLDRTNYFATFPASDDNLDWALDLEADRMINSFISQEHLDSEMTVVRNEFEAGENSPFRVLMQRVLSTAYLWHNYGNSTIGARSDIENVPIERLRAFYRTYYQPDNAVLLVAGRFDEDRALALIQQHFGAIPRPDRELPRFYTLEPTQDGERSVTLRRVGDVQLVTAAYHVPPGSHPDYAAIEILTRVLADDPSGRLHKALVETNRASSIFGFGFQLRDPGTVLFGAEVRREASLDEARDGLLSILEGFADNPPTTEEVERARLALLKNIELTLNASDRVGLQLSEWMAMGDWRLFFLHRDRLRAITAEEVQQVASRYLKPSNRTLGMFIPTPDPDRAEIPAAPDIAEMLRDYKGDEAIAAGEAFDPSPAHIEERTLRLDGDTGLALALLPKKTRGETVVAAMTLRFGDEETLRGRAPAAALAGRMLMRGTTERTREQLRDELDRLKARVSVSGSATQATVSIETVREHLPDVLRLVAEILRQPSFPASEFEQLKQEQLASVEQQMSEPQAIGSAAFRRHLGPYPPDDVRYVRTPEEEIAALTAVTLDEVKRFYEDFYGASHAELAVVGDIDVEQVESLARELFGEWRSQKPFARVVSEYRDIPPLDVSLEAPDKANAYFIAGLNLELRDDDPDYPALVLGNYMLGGGFLNSRLAVRIRQQEGISYGVGSQLGASSLDRLGSFVTFAIYAPENVQRLETAFREEIARMLETGFTDEEIAAAKSGYLQSRQLARAQDAGLARQLATYLYLDRTLQWDAEFESRMSALTADDIRDAMRRHIQPEKITIVRVGDFGGRRLPD